MNDLSRLDARSFHSRLGDLLRAELVALGAFLVALAEFDERRLFHQLGYASLFEYLNRGLGLSRGAAHHRRAAARLVQKFPEVLAPIEQGRLCFTTASILATVMTEENRAEVLPRFFGLSKQEALEVAAEIKPRAVVPQRTVVTPQPRREPRPEGAEAGFSSPAEPADAPLAPSAGNDVPTLPWTNPDQKVHLGELGSARTTVVPLTGAESRVHMTVSREILALLKKAKAGESHRNPGATDDQVLKLALEALLEKQSKRKASVPAKVKREVVARDEGRCQWRLPDGTLCGATARLEIDHVVPRGRGGPSTVDNCRVLCKGHNLEAARLAYGDAVMDLFTRPGVAREPPAEYRAGAHPQRAGAASPPGPRASRGSRGSRANRETLDALVRTGGRAEGRDAGVAGRSRPLRGLLRSPGRYSSRYTASDPSFSQTSTFETCTRSPSVSRSLRFASS